jgi:deoxyadenosine/deoxycytidine kinase
LIQITDLLKIIEAEEERDSFQVLKTFYLDSQLWTASTHLRIMTSKRKRLLKSLLTANQKINKENLRM